MTTKALPIPNSLPANRGEAPCVSLYLPFEPKMSLTTELEYQLKRAVAKIEKELLAGYTAQNVAEIMIRLRTLVAGLDFNTHKKSIAIFVSASVEKVYYLDMLLEEKLIIDDSFAIRDLVYSKKETLQYLVLVLSSKQSRIYFGNDRQLTRIVSDIPEHMAAYRNDIPSRVSNFSDPAKRKEVMLDKFLHHIDEGLSLLIKAYPFPLFVMGTTRIIGHFKKLSHNKQHVSAYLKGSYGGANEKELYALLKPLLSGWKKIKEKDLLKNIDAAMGAGKLAFGIEEVWKEAVHKRGRLLIVEKNFLCSAMKGNKRDKIYKCDPGTRADIKDAVDDVIEKVLVNGGDVEFIDEGVLTNFEHIALIDFY